MLTKSYDQKSKKLQKWPFLELINQNVKFIVLFAFFIGTTFADSSLRVKRNLCNCPDSLETFVCVAGGLLPGTDVSLVNGTYGFICKDTTKNCLRKRPTYGQQRRGACVRLFDGMHFT
uniref:Uncharacterized protein n=1 Tax=Globodera pallida TaxID=36090 RepID=A0A183C570_GLOPA